MEEGADRSDALAEGGVLGLFFVFKQKTAYEIGTGDWSSDVCSSDLTDATDAGIKTLYSFGKKRKHVQYDAKKTATHQLDRKSVV